MRTLRGSGAALLLASALVSALAGCSQQPTSPTTPLHRTSFPTPLGAVSSLEELRAAAVAAGMYCAQLTEDSGVYASESGHCSSQDRLQVYKSDDGLKRDVDYLTKNVPGSTLLVGPNWLINTGQAEHLRTQLGGAVRTSAPSRPAPPPVDYAPTGEAYGQWHEVEGLMVRVAKPTRLIPDQADGVCLFPKGQPWKANITIKNTGKKERDLSDVGFGPFDEHADLYLVAMDLSGLLNPLSSTPETIAPGAARTIPVAICPNPDEFDALTPMTLEISGSKSRQHWTIGANS